jgi:hypothetical protein
VPAVAVIDDADVPLLFALLIASAIFAAPNVDAIVRMAAISAVIGVVANLAFGGLRALWRASHPVLRAAPLLLALLLLGCRLLPEHMP